MGKRYGSLNHHNSLDYTWQEDMIYQHVMVDFTSPYPPAITGQAIEHQPFSSMIVPFYHWNHHGSWIFQPLLLNCIPNCTPIWSTFLDDYFPGGLHLLPISWGSAAEASGVVERCKRKALLTAAKGRAERVKAGHACSGDCGVIFMGFHEAFMGENRGTLVKPMQIILVVTVMDGNEPPVPSPHVFLGSSNGFCWWSYNFGIKSICGVWCFVLFC